MQHLLYALLKKNNAIIIRENKIISAHAQITNAGDAESIRIAAIQSCRPGWDISRS